VRPNTLVTKILELSREDPRLLQQLEKFRRAVTVMFTDIKGSTEYFERFGDIAGLAMVHECNDLLRTAIEQHGGRVIKTIGDAVMAAFDNCNESIRAAISMQRRLREKNASKKKDDEILVRIGMHHGIGIVKSDDVFGDVVNVASRVESLAQPGHIIISDCLQRLISPSDFSVVPLGRFRLKGKMGDHDLFQVRWSETELAPLKLAHTTVIGSGPAHARLQHLTRDGTVAAEYPLSAEDITVSNMGVISKSTEDSKPGEMRARFSLVEGQPIVEDVSKKGRIFIRLVATYSLEDGDIVAMGSQLFKFACRRDLVAAATALGKTLLNVTRLLNESAVEFVAINSDFSERPERYRVPDEEVTFGRKTATYSFEDDGLMSRTHARVYHRGEDFFLEDLTSRNGTFVLVRGKAPVPFGAPVLVGGKAFRVVQ
jgi:class 3 adenylate cyclase